MTGQQKHIIVIVCIFIFSLTAITCVNKGVGYYLRHAQLVDVYYSYETMEEVTQVIDDPGTPFDGYTITGPRYVTHKGWEKRSLPEGSVQMILSAIDIALLGAGVFAYLIFLSFENQEERKKTRLFCILGVYIIVCVIVVYSIYNHYVHKTYTLDRNSYSVNERLY